jgi:hypothetical protein
LPLVVAEVVDTAVVDIVVIVVDLGVVIGEGVEVEIVVDADIEVDVDVLQDTKSSEIAIRPVNIIQIVPFFI